MSAQRRPAPSLAWALATALTLVAAAIPAARADDTLRGPGMPLVRPDESMVYDVRFGGLDVGTARMKVIGLETVRGRPAWHTRLEIDGRLLGFSVRDALDSWIDAQTGNSLRFAQDSVQGSTVRSSSYEIEPENGVYRQEGKASKPTVAQPLDQGSFMYFLRGQPLEPGRTYRYSRYFVPDRNPVTVSVLRREPVEVPAGRFDTVVLQPTLRTEGVFSEDGRAEIWLTDDERRWMVQMVTRLKFGTLSLHLRRAA